MFRRLVEYLLINERESTRRLFVTCRWTLSTEQLVTLSVFLYPLLHLLAASNGARHGRHPTSTVQCRRDSCWLPQIGPLHCLLSLSLTVALPIV